MRTGWAKISAAALAAALLAGVGSAAVTSVQRPHIIWKRITFGGKRKAEMAGYMKRHYGIHTWRLRHPHVIVEHYTGSSFSSAWNTFASDSPDSELHELPGTCAHFIIDTDGKIYQLVKLGIACRHTVGLNYTAFGIEHAGYSDADILNNPRQLRASLKLTLWLSRHYHVKLKNIIGHNESLTSPYHKERYKAWRCQTHGDWNYADMTIYRSKLRKLARSKGISMGPLPKQRPSKC